MKLKHILTERDNETFCPVRLLALTGGVEFLCVTGYLAFTTAKFDVQGFGVGLAAVVAAIGGAIAAKATTEAKNV